MNQFIVEWISDLILDSLCVFLCTLFTISVIRHLSINVSESDSAESLPLSLKISMCLVFIGGIIQSIFGILGGSFGLFSGPNQFKICNILFAIVIYFLGFAHFLVFNFFIEQLRYAFENSLFPISKRNAATIRIIYAVLWLSILTASIFIFNPVPFNVYTQQNDYNGTAQVCSNDGGGHYTKTSALIILLWPVSVSSAWISVLIIFTNKLFKILKQLRMIHYGNSNELNSTLIVILKKRAFLVAVASLQSIGIIWINMFVFKIKAGIVWSIISIINKSIVFLSLTWNVYWFKLFKCDRCAVVCCGCFEKCVEYIISNDPQVQLSAATASISNASIESGGDDTKGTDLEK